VLGNKALGRICGPGKEEAAGGRRKIQNCIMNSFIIYTAHQVLLN
jgi:hypothetical protein